MWESHVAHICVILVSDDSHMWNLYVPNMRMPYACQIVWHLVAHTGFSLWLPCSISHMHLHLSYMCQVSLQYVAPMRFPYDYHVAKSRGTHMIHIGLRWLPYVKPICAEYENAICVSDSLATCGTNEIFHVTSMWQRSYAFASVISVSGKFTICSTYEFPIWLSCDKVMWHI